MACNLISFGLAAWARKSGQRSCRWRWWCLRRLTLRRQADGAEAVLGDGQFEREIDAVAVRVGRSAQVRLNACNGPQRNSDKALRKSSLARRASPESF